MSKVHHTTELDECCIDCGRPFLMLWENKKETNGRSETKWGAGYCTECKTKRNGGKPPLGLHALNEIARRGITKEKYYEEHGY